MNDEVWISEVACYLDVNVVVPAARGYRGTQEARRITATTVS
jgi:hypothetical protein